MPKLKDYIAARVAAAAGEAGKLLGITADGTLKRFDLDKLPITPSGSSVSKSLGEWLGQALPSIPTMAALGDSITAMASGKSTVEPRGWYIQGFLTWARILSKGRVFVPNDWNFGVAGETTAQILARVGQVIAANPGVCIVHAGTNDAALTANQTIANLTAIYDALQGAGIRVIAIPILVQSSTAAIMGRALRVNQWIESQRFSRRGFKVVDCSAIWTDPATGLPRSIYTSDNIHPNFLCNWYIGKAVADALVSWYPDVPGTFVNSNDVYDAVNNPTGNLFSNGALTGTGGTLSNGFTGQLATSLSANGINTPAGATVTFSKVTKPDGRIFQQLVFGGTYSHASPAQQQMSANLGVANISPGDVLEMVAEIEVDAGVQNLAYAGIGLQLTGTTQRFSFDLVQDWSATLPTEAWTGLLRTPYFTVPEGASGLTMTLRWNIKGVGASSPLAATIRYGAVSVRKVI